MKKTISVLLLLASLLGAETLEWSRNFKMNFNAAQKADLPLLVYVTQADCSVCQWMEENAFADDEVKRYLKTHYKFVKLYLNDKELPEHLKTFATPTFYILNAEGKEIADTLMGGKNAESFYEYLEEGYFSYTHQVKK